MKYFLGDKMYLDKEKLKTASIKDILKELEIIEEELFCVMRSLPLSKLYMLRVYRNRLLEEIKIRIKNMSLEVDK